MPQHFTTAELEAYLDEELAPEVLAEIENVLQSQPETVQELIAINSRREAGVHSIGGIWRKFRLSCPSRDQLGSFLLGAMTSEVKSYVQFHLETVGCRFCLASLGDLESRQEGSTEEATTRRARYFQTSAGYLKKDS